MFYFNNLTEYYVVLHTQLINGHFPGIHGLTDCSINCLEQIF